MSSKYTSLPSEEPKRATRSKKKTNEHVGPAFAAYRDTESPQSSPTLHTFDDTDALLTTQPWEALASSRKRTLGEGENGSHPNLQAEDEGEEEDDASEEDESATEVDDVDRPLAPMPKAVWFILGNEACERFSFYGMKAILYTYLSSYIQYSPHASREIVHIFNAMAYFMPLFGGYLADGALGKFKTIVYLSLLYSIGNVVLAVSAIPNGQEPLAGLCLFGLLLIAIGTGGIKPNVSSFGGDQFLPTQVKEIAAFFSMFYFCINAGSVASMLITPYIMDTTCFGGKCFFGAFGLPAILMILATIIFVLGQRNYRIVVSEGNVIMQILTTLRYAFKHWRATPKAQRQGRAFLDYAMDQVALQRSQSPSQRGAALTSLTPQFLADVQTLGNIFTLFYPLPIFWALFDQQGSTWIAQAKKMQSSIAITSSFTLRIPAETMQVWNALLILVMIPIFQRFLYPALTKCGVQLTPLKKMTLGMLLTSAAFVIAGLLDVSIAKSAPESIPILWQVPQYIVITAGEVMFSITGLEFAYSQSPTSMKAVCASAWLLTVACGNVIVVIMSMIQPFGDDTISELFAYSGLMFLAAMLFAVIAWRYRYTTVPARGRSRSSRAEQQTRASSQDSLL